MVDDKHPEALASKKSAWFEERGISVPTEDDEPLGDTAALSEDCDVGVRVLAEYYDLEQLNEEFVEEQIEILAQRVEALSDRTPRHAENLEARLLALEAVRPAVENEYADTSSWESLEANGDFD